MSTINPEDPKFCGQCGTVLADDKICRNQGCPAYGLKTGSSYPGYTPAAVGKATRELPQGPITPTLRESGTALPTEVSYPLQPVRQMNRVYLTLIVVLALMLVGSGVFIGILLGSRNTRNSGNTSSNNVQQSGTGLVGNSTVTSVVQPTTPPSPTAAPSPTATTCAKPCVLYQETGADNWQGWALSSDWRIVTQGLLISNGGGSTPSAIAPYSVTGLTDFAVEAKMRTPPTSSQWWEIGVTACGTSTSNGWQGYNAGATKDYDSPTAFIDRTGNGIGNTNFDPGTAWHTYKLEVKGNILSLFIDNAPVVQATDDQYQTCGGQVGFYDGGGGIGITVQVSSFEVLAL